MALFIDTLIGDTVYPFEKNQTLDKTVKLKGFCHLDEETDQQKPNPLLKAIIGAPGCLSQWSV